MLRRVVVIDSYFSHVCSVCCVLSTAVTEFFGIKPCDILHIISKNTGKFLCMLDLFLFSHILTHHFVYIFSVLFEVSSALYIKIIVI